MILEAIGSLFGHFLIWVFGLIMAPIGVPPSELVEAITWVGDVWLLLQSFDAWLPVTFTMAVAGAVTACYGISLVIGLSRTILSYFTFGGGAR